MPDDRFRPQNVIPLRERQPQHRPQPPEIFTPPTLAASLQGIEPPALEWFVDDILLRGEVTLFAGATKLGKTFVCQMLMTACATGRDWFGRKTTQCRSLAIFSEDRKAILHRRQDAISAHYGIEHADLELEVAWFGREDKADPTLVEFEGWSSAPQPTAWWHQVTNYCTEHGVRLLIIDTAARTFRGKEADRGQVTAYIGMLTKLAAQIDGAVLLTCHPSKGNGSWYSGSTAWESSARLTISLESHKDFDRETGSHENERTLYTMGSNYGARPAPIPLAWQDRVLVATEPARPRGPLSADERAELDGKMLAGLRRCVACGAKVAADDLAPSSLAHQARRRAPREYSRYTFGELCSASARLIDSGRAVVVTVGVFVLIRTPDQRYPGEAP